MPITSATSRVDSPSSSSRGTRWCGTGRATCGTPFVVGGAACIVRELSGFFPGCRASRSLDRSGSGALRPATAGAPAHRPACVVPSDTHCARCDTTMVGRPPARGCVRRSETSSISASCIASSASSARPHTDYVKRHATSCARINRRLSASASPVAAARTDPCTRPARVPARPS